MIPTLHYIWEGRHSGILLAVIPAKAGIQSFTRALTPTFVGVTNVKEFMTHYTRDILP